MGSIRLIEAARQQQGLSGFVYLSTCAVHDKILNDRPLDEQHPLWAKSHYGAHKAAVEKFVHSFGHRLRISHLCTSSFWHLMGLLHRLNIRNGLI